MVDYIHQEMPNKSCKLIVFHKTALKKGDYLVPFGDNVIMLYSSTGEANTYKQIWVNKKIRWFIEGCKLFKYARQSKNFKLTRLIVNLLDGEEDKRLGCESILELLTKNRLSIPHDFHCSTCSNFMSWTKPSKKVK